MAQPGENNDNQPNDDEPVMGAFGNMNNNLAKLMGGEEDDDDSDKPDEEDDPDQPDEEPEIKDRQENTSTKDDSNKDEADYLAGAKNILDIFGVELEDDAPYENTREGVEALVRDTVLSTLPPHVQDAVEFMLKGGDLTDYTLMAADMSSLDNLDMTSEVNQEKIVHDYYAELGLSDKAIERAIKGLKEDGELADEGQKAFDHFSGQIKEQRQAIEQRNALARDQELAEYKKMVNDSLGYLKTVDNLGGYPATLKQKQIVADALFKIDEDGKTDWERKMSDPKVQMAAAHFIYNGASIKNTVRTQETKKISELLKTDATSSGKGGSGNEAGKQPQLKAEDVMPTGLLNRS